MVLIWVAYDLKIKDGLEERGGGKGRRGFEIIVFGFLFGRLDCPWEIDKEPLSNSH